MKTISPTSNIDTHLDSVIHGDCVEVLRTLPDKSVDLVFADELPPATGSSAICV